MALERVGDLPGGQDQAARRVDDQVDGAVGVGQLDGPQHLFRVVHVDVAHEWKAEEAHRLLAVHQRDHPAPSRALEPVQQA